MKKWMIIILLIVICLPSCKKDSTFISTNVSQIFNDVPQIKELFAVTGVIIESIGEMTIVYYTVSDVEWLELWMDNQCFKSGPVEQYVHSSYGFQYFKETVFKVVAKNPVGTASKEIIIKAN